MTLSVPWDDNVARVDKKGKQKRNKKKHKKTKALSQNRERKQVLGVKTVT